MGFNPELVRLNSLYIRSELLAPDLHAMLLYSMPLPSQELKCPESEMSVSEPVASERYYFRIG